MSVELSQDFNQLVKKVDFFPYEWSSNLLAVCFADSVKFFIYNESRKEVLHLNNSVWKLYMEQFSNISLYICVIGLRRLNRPLTSNRHTPKMRPSIDGCN